MSTVAVFIMGTLTVSPLFFLRRVFIIFTWAWDGFCTRGYLDGVPISIGSPSGALGMVQLGFSRVITLSGRGDPPPHFCARPRVGSEVKSMVPVGTHPQLGQRSIVTEGLPGAKEKGRGSSSRRSRAWAEGTRKAADLRIACCCGSAGSECSWACWQAVSACDAALGAATPARAEGAARLSQASLAGTSGGRAERGACGQHHS